MSRIYELALISLLTTICVYLWMIHVDAKKVTKALAEHNMCWVCSSPEQMLKDLRKAK